MVFASPSGEFYRDRTTHGCLSGLSYLDNFIVTRKSCPLTGTLQKHMPTPTRTATPHTTGPLGLRFRAQYHDSQRASKSLAARHRDSLRCCQTHAFLPTRDYNVTTFV